MVKLIQRQINKDGTITVAFPSSGEDEKPKTVCVATKRKNVPTVIAIEEVAKDKLTRILNRIRQGETGRDKK